MSTHLSPAFMMISNAFTKLEIHKVVARGSNPRAETPYEKYTKPQTIHKMGNQAESLVGYPHGLHSRIGGHLGSGRDSNVDYLPYRQSGLVALGIKGGRINYYQLKV